MFHISAGVAAKSPTGEWVGGTACKGLCSAAEAPRLGRCSQARACPVLTQADLPLPLCAGKLVVDPIKLRPVSRLGGTTYGTVGQLFDIGRPLAVHAHKGPAEYTAS